MEIVLWNELIPLRLKCQTSTAKEGTSLSIFRIKDFLSLIKNIIFEIYSVRHVRSIPIESS